MITCIFIRLSQFLRSLENFFLGLYVPQSCFKLEAQLVLCCWKPPTTPKALCIDLSWKELLWFAIKHHLVLFDLLHFCNVSLVSLALKECLTPKVLVWQEFPEGKQEKLEFLTGLGIQLGITGGGTVLTAATAARLCRWPTTAFETEARERC